METITEKQLEDLFKRAAIYGALKIWRPLRYDRKEEAKNLRNVEIFYHGQIKANFFHSPSRYDDDNEIKNSIDLELDELYRFETIQELTEFVAIEDAKKEKELDKQREKEYQAELRKKEKIKGSKEYQNFLKLKEKYERL